MAVRILSTLSNNLMREPLLSFMILLLLCTESSCLRYHQREILFCVLASLPNWYVVLRKLERHPNIEVFYYRVLPLEMKI